MHIGSNGADALAKGLKENSIADIGSDGACTVKD